MKTIFSPLQLAHDPRQEISDGMLKPAVEIPSRATMVRDRVIAERLGELLEPRDFGRAPLRRVHDAGYLEFLESFWERWTGAGRSGEAFPFVWPVRGLSVEPEPEHVDGLLGRYSFDAGTPLGEHTFEAARRKRQLRLVRGQPRRGRRAVRLRALPTSRTSRCRRLLWWLLLSQQRRDRGPMDA